MPQRPSQAGAAVLTAAIAATTFLWPSVLGDGGQRSLVRKRNFAGRKAVIETRPTNIRSDVVPIVIESARSGRARKLSPKIDVQLFELCAPLLADHPLDANTDGPTRIRP